MNEGLRRDPGPADGRPPSEVTPLVPKGELGRAIAAYPWERTPLGALESWPPALRMSVNLMLEAGAPMAVIWGREFLQELERALKQFANG